MKVAIIGAGNVGTALADLVRPGRSRRHHHLARRPGRSRRRSRRGARAPTNRDAVGARTSSSSRSRSTELRRVAADIAGAPAGKPVVDVSNRMASTPMVRSRTRPPRTPRTSRRCCRTPVVKAFNTLFASARPTRSPTASTLDGFVAGDDADAKATVLELVEASASGRSMPGRSPCPQLEGLAWLNISRNITTVARGSPPGCSSVPGRRARRQQLIDACTRRAQTA